MIDATDSSGELLVINERASLNFTGTLKDMSGNAIAKASVSTCVLRLYDISSESVINSKEEVSIIDDVESDGTYKVKLYDLDNVIVSEELESNSEERHAVRVTFTYDDSEEIRTAIQETRFSVRKL